ncbi:hypothetical protein FMEXI_3213 [Fusarium mexicanum]|uniref:Secreted protein CSS2 C-terminal domain-containing protein n=1 Tax=Fusarium mexicanum TaxID=751941 RepID=A0A8H5N3Y6_9HYPO|nr:hypothetical protein FMEXI_3213 [Fusarium mexicanum]
MSPNISFDSGTIDRLNRAAAGYIVPLLLIVTNLITYINKDASKTYDLTVLNVFANIYLLGAYLRGDRSKIIWLRWTFEIKHAVGLAECGHFSGYAGPNKEIYYQYETDDGHCDTVIEQIEVERAIERQIKKEGSTLRTTECMDLTDTWVWNGHLLVGPTKGFDYEIECGPKLVVIPVSMMWDLESLEKAEKEKEEKSEKEKEKQADREL